MEEDILDLHRVMNYKQQSMEEVLDNIIKNNLLRDNDLLHKGKIEDFLRD